MGDDVERLNALTEAAAEGKTNDVIKLLEDGIPINGRDGNSKTALYRACCQGKSQTVRELLKRGADCNITSKEELTPLYIGRIFLEVSFNKGTPRGRNRQQTFSVYLWFLAKNHLIAEIL